MHDFSNLPSCLWHLLNNLRQRFAKSLWQEEESNDRSNCQSPQDNIRQVIKVYTCKEKLEP